MSEKHYDFFNQPPITLGPMTSDSWRRDPKHLLFVLSRYKFVSKLIRGTPRALEVGCGDGFGTRIVRQHCLHLTATDFDDKFIDVATAAGKEQPWIFDVAKHNFVTDGPFSGPLFDASYALDVLEHIPLTQEDTFIRSIRGSTDSRGLVVFGTPSLNSQKYASELSKKGHINCKTHEQLENDLHRHFGTVLMFGMNDEIVHTGYAPFCQYLFAVCMS